MRIEDAEKLANFLLGLHGLKDWRIVWNGRWRGKHGGKCKIWEKEVHLGVEVCRANNEQGVMELVLHEIAHALCVEGDRMKAIRGERVIWHGKEWRKKAREIGCSGDTHPRIRWPEKQKKMRVEVGR